MSQLLDLIKRHEGFRDKPYWDKTGQEMYLGLSDVDDWPQDDLERHYKGKLGHLTIGYGFNLEAGMSEEEAELLLIHRVGKACDAAEEYPWYASLNDARQAVIVSMIYQMGPTGFAGFKRMIAALEEAVRLSSAGIREGNLVHFPKAADEMLDSKWARQTPGRAKELAEMMRSGEWPSEAV